MEHALQLSLVNVVSNLVRIDRLCTPCVIRFLVYQMILSLEDELNDDARSISIPHDASADDMKASILRLVETSSNGSVGQVVVSRESNGARGLQAHRYGDFESTVLLLHTVTCSLVRVPIAPTPRATLLVVLRMPST